MKTIEIFKQKQNRIVTILSSLRDFLKEGKKYDVDINQEIIDKIENVIDASNDKPLKIALVGGFSEGKTSIVAAWSENYDESSMKISQGESTDQVTIYDSKEGYQLADTPGLFGFKETGDKQKYKEITEKYVSESDLVFYVMSSDNPIKDSQKEELQWLFVDLNLLPRTVFILSRFDEEADLEDEHEYEGIFEIKKESVIIRLKEFGIIKNDEIEIVAISANPYGEGIDNWLKNIDEYKKLSHITDLQKATEKKILTFGGKNELVFKKQQTVVRDLLDQAVPAVDIKMNRMLKEIEHFDKICKELRTNSLKVQNRIVKTRLNLREFISDYFSDLIIQVKGTTIETIDEFFEKNIGEKGIIIETKIENEFEKQIGDINSEISLFRISFDTSVQHFNNIIGDLAYDGIKNGGKLLKEGVVNLKSNNILAIRDIILPNLKFKPWGAVKLAKNINKGAMYLGSFLGIGIEVWDSISYAMKKERLERAKEDMRNNFNNQREEYLKLLNDNDQFTSLFFPEYYETVKQIDELKKEIDERRQIKKDFEDWKKKGEIIEAEFVELYSN